MIKEWLEGWKPANKAEALMALREIMQEITLAGLQRAGFFEKAALYDGMALRTIHGLYSFSEDLIFSLLAIDPNFSLDNYLGAILTEFESLGMTVTVREKQKANQNNIESAFLKSETIWKDLVLEDIIAPIDLDQKVNIIIKIEVDTQPPLGFQTEEKLHTIPFSFYVKCFTLPDLFAGKIHALLFRKSITKLKGRDWFDMEWYVKKGTSLHLQHFLLRAKNSGSWDKETITEDEFRTLLRSKIDSVDFDMVKADIRRFIPDPRVLNIWGPVYFHELVKQLKIV